MGTRKKLVLAALVSLTMVLAFLYGAIPSYDSERTGAAVPGDDGRLDMVKLLDHILGIKQVTDIALYSQLDGVVVKTPIDNAVVPPIAIPLNAAITGSGTELVTFVANADDEDAWTGDFGWNGEVFTEPVAAPWWSSIDLAGFLTGIGSSQSTVLIYALVNATAGGVGEATLIYEAVNEADETVLIALNELGPDYDADNNGLPDDLFNLLDGILPGEVWVTTVLIDGELRTVMVVNLDQGAADKQALGSIYVSPNENITVESPDLQAFVDAGLIEEGETGLLIIEVVDELAALLDVVDGFDSPQAWADAVNAQAPGA